MVLRSLKGRHEAGCTMSGKLRTDLNYCYEREVTAPAGAEKADRPATRTTRQPKAWQSLGAGRSGSFWRPLLAEPAVAPTGKAKPGFA